MIEMIVDSVRVSLANHQRLVILRERGGVRCLPIWIGHLAADSIIRQLQNVQTSRPLTHGLIVSIIASLSARVEHVVITEFRDDIFYAKIVLQATTGKLELDSSPGDAIAVAVRAQSPIYVEDEMILEKFGVQLDDETSQVAPESDKSPGQQSPLTEEELRNLSAFEGFVDELDLKGLGEEEGPPKEGGQQHG